MKETYFNLHYKLISSRGDKRQEKKNKLDEIDFYCKIPCYFSMSHNYLEMLGAYFRIFVPGEIYVIRANLSYLLTACSEVIYTVRIEWLLLEYSFILCVPIDLFLIPV